MLVFGSVERRGLGKSSEGFGTAPHAHMCVLAVVSVGWGRNGCTCEVCYMYSLSLLLMHRSGVVIEPMLVSLVVSGLL